MLSDTRVLNSFSSWDNIHFLTDSLGKNINPLIPSAIGWILSLLIFKKDGFGIRLTIMVERPLIKETRNKIYIYLFISIYVNLFISSYSHYLSIYLSIIVCSYISIYLSVNIYSSQCFICMYACLLKYLWNTKNRYICMYVYMYVCTYVCMYARVYVCMHVCMYVCTCVCIYVCM